MEKTERAHVLAGGYVCFDVDDHLRAEAGEEAELDPRGTTFCLFVMVPDHDRRALHEVMIVLQKGRDLFGGLGCWPALIRVVDRFEAGQHEGGLHDTTPPGTQHGTEEGDTQVLLVLPSLLVGITRFLCFHRRDPSRDKVLTIQGDLTVNSRNCQYYITSISPLTNELFPTSVALYE